MLVTGPAPDGDRPPLERALRERMSALGPRGIYLPDAADVESLAARARPRDLVLPIDAGDILSADTLVIAEGEIMGKPADRSDAIRMLKLLSDRKHLVITGVCITDSNKEIAFAETTEVWFHPLDISGIEYYVDHCQPYDKAGAYAIQEWIGVTGIRSIRGDFYNVMGLPVSRVLRQLKIFS